VQDCTGGVIMSNISQKTSYRHIFIGTLALVAVLWIGGCGDFLGEKAAGIQSQNILDELGTIKKTPEPNIPIPEIYKQPPKIVEQVVGGKPDWKLFYFCKYHTSEELKLIIQSQFATQIFDEKGKSTTVADYNVSSNPATNQLIVRCPTKDDVNAALQVLQEIDIPPIQVKLDCLISEIYADKTIDRETTIDISHLLGEDISLAPGARAFGSDVASLLQENELLPAFPGASIREVGRAKMGLKIGYLSTKHNFITLVDLLESRGYLKVLMNPTLETVNGKPATVSSSQHVPLEKITTYVPTQSEYTLETRTEYVDVVDSLKITPHVFADGYIGLETDIVLGSKLTPEGVKQLPIITKKEIENKENRIRPGESLVIGGIRKTEKRDVIRGVPFLKDIPLLGFLFSGRDFEERAVETIFILTPTISTGGIPRQEMVEEIERKHEAPTSPGLGKAITDPLGLEAQEKQHIRESEQSRLEAEAEKARVRNALRKATEQLEKAEAEVKRLKDELEQAKTEAENPDRQESRKDSNEPQPSAEESEQEAEAKQARSDKSNIPGTEEKAEIVHASL
jgi:Flp pilus assembly secretin CpaC